MSKHFYGKPIPREQQQRYIDQLLSKYLDQPPTEELLKAIYEELMDHKHQGLITIPFKVTLRRDPTGRQHDYIEVLLESKV